MATPDELAGHRQRLRRRFIEAGPGALADHEMLELLLFAAIPRRDTKSVARALLREFGSYAAVLRAEPEALANVAGVGETAIVTLRAVADAATRLAREEVMDRRVLGGWQALLDYLRIDMAHRQTEQFRMLYLDTKNALIADELQQKGTVNHTPVYPREVVKRALEVGATAMIMVHNHPSGDPSPSKEDIRMTQEIRDIGARLGVTLHDHLIIGKSGHSSFKTMGLL